MREGAGMSQPQGVVCLPTRSLLRKWLNNNCWYVYARSADSEWLRITRVRVQDGVLQGYAPNTGNWFSVIQARQG